VKLCRECYKPAVWVYGPDMRIGYCDEHVYRGCSCNIDPITREEDRDDLGRLMPCCEYLYCENGFDN
jgi:hypothetical protein